MFYDGYVLVTTPAARRRHGAHTSVRAALFVTNSENIDNTIVVSFVHSPTEASQLPSVDDPAFATAQLPCFRNGPALVCPRAHLGEDIDPVRALEG